MSKKIAFIAYETPFAPCGGIAAVMARLPDYIQKVSGIDTIVITPYHHKMEKTTSLKMEHVGSIVISFQDRTINVNVSKYEDKQKISWYFLLPEDEHLFAGTRHPYDVGGTQEEISENLKRDSLFFGAAVGKSLHIISPETQWILCMQDWEAATTTLRFDNQNKEHKLFLTLHNSYDSGSVEHSNTVLERTIPLMNDPIFTVSEQFALELTQDVFQTDVMAPHLQNLLKTRIYGVDNGPFVKIAIPDDVLNSATKGDYAGLIEWKKGKRKRALNALDDHITDDKQPIWGDRSKFIHDDAPWFVFAGRDDTRQKGYDVAALAIRIFIKEEKGDARFLFFPMPGDERLEGLNFLKELAEDFPEDVLVMPFIWQKGFFSALQGATYGVMPSLYEPFGMASEFYLQGTAGIGRATGGLLQQIIPLKSASSFSEAVKKRTVSLHLFSANPTGILYREKDGLETAIEDWQGINKTEYNSGDNNRVKERQKYNLFREMANELMLSFIDGIKIYKESPMVYYKMLVDGIFHIQNNFSWDKNAQEYIRKML